MEGGGDVRLGGLCSGRGVLDCKRAGVGAGGGVMCECGGCDWDVGLRDG